MIDERAQRAQRAMSAIGEPQPTKLGRYRLVDLVARGGMGSVYLARATGVGGFARPVALKLLHRHLADERQVVEMFLAEARLVARIAHRNVVDVLDVDILDGEHLIAMRFVEGGSLRQLFGVRREKLPPGVALRVIHDTLLGLHAAHEAKAEDGEPLGIIHRDVSPSNVLLDLDGHAQLTDFGVARAKGGVVSSVGMVKGKLRYLAPEQAKGDPLDRRVDVFAAGIVLWEALTGKPLFRGENDVDVIREILERPIPPPDASFAIDEVCLKALERDPSRRYATAEEFARALATAGERTMASHEEVAKVVREAFAEDVEQRRAALAKDATAPVTMTKPVMDPNGGETTISMTMSALDRSAAASRTRVIAAAAAVFAIAMLAMVVVIALRRPADAPATSAPNALPGPPAASETAAHVDAPPPSAPPATSATEPAPALAAQPATKTTRSDRKPPPAKRADPGKTAPPSPAASGPYIPPNL